MTQPIDPIRELVKDDPEPIVDPPLSDEQSEIAAIAVQLMEDNSELNSTDALELAGLIVANHGNIW
jgi:hypothetical protein